MSWISPVRARRSLSLVLLAGSGLLVPGAGSAQRPAPQGSAAEALNQQGDAALERRQYPEAIAAYRKLIQGYPNSELATDTRFHLAYANFLAGQYDAAADDLRKLLAAPTPPPEILEQAALLLPRVLSQQANVLPPASPARQTGFEAAVRGFDAFVDKFPKSTELETALYGRAVAEYQTARYPDAARDLRRNVASSPTSDTGLDSTFLLALTVATQANLALSRAPRPPAGADAALKGYAEAEKLLGDILTQRTDLSLANDAEFQLGETLLAHAAASPTTQQKALYGRALAAYQAVEPKAGMIDAQTARVRRLNDARVAELRRGAAGNRALIRQLDQRRLLEQGKLEALQAREDPVLTARLKGGAVYHNLGRYDEARVLMNTLLPSIRKPDDEKLALYYVTLSFAGQNLADKAAAAYGRFQAKYAGDPLAENLPLVVGNLFLAGDKPDPARANQYFDEFTRLYPGSRLLEAALLRQAAASVSLGRYDDALKTLDTFLAAKPKRDLQATAELARARVLQDKGDLDGALAAFRQARDTYPDLPEGEEAAYWVGATLLQKKDAAGAVNELKALAAKHPQGKLTPAALLTLARAQEATGAKDAALATLTDVSTRFPDAPEAAGTFFARANLYLADRKYDDVVRVLTGFVDQHPDAEQTAAAYAQIAAVQAQGKRYDAAVATYEKQLAQRPDAPEAPDVLGKQTVLWQRAAQGLGNYAVLGAAQRDEWKADLNQAVAAGERQLARFPDAPATALGLQTLAECQRMLVEAKAKTRAEEREYFQKLADQYRDKPAARSRLRFRLAALTAETDPARAFAERKAAYDPNVVYSPADLDGYTQGLLAGDDSSTTAAVFDKLAADYPLPPGVGPAQAPADVQEAQALALYGRGTLAARQGDTAGAARNFSALKRDYPRSPKVPEADLGLAEGLVAQGRGDEAMPLLSVVVRAPTAAFTVRARGLFLVGEVQAKKGSFEAVDAYLKAAAFYPATPEAPEGLWKGGQMLEQQAATLGDSPARPGAPTKASQLARARKAYEQLVAKYPDSPWTAQAKARVMALPSENS